MEKSDYKVRVVDFRNGIMKYQLYACVYGVYGKVYDVDYYVRPFDENSETVFLY